MSRGKIQEKLGDEGSWPSEVCVDFGLRNSDMEQRRKVSSHAHVGAAEKLDVLVELRLLLS